MKRILMWLSYDGKNYKGFQVQPNEKTIQLEVESAIKKALKEDIKIVASGRTDSGVSAISHPAHFDTKSKIESEKLAFAINAFLPKDIRVVKTEEVNKNFHARYSKSLKTYEYKIYVSKVKLPLKDEKALQIYTMPNVKLMKKAAKLIKGKHDFKAFMSAKSGVKDTVRTVKKLKIDLNENEIILSITGEGFLYNMVRIITGTLLDVGYGKKTLKDVEELFITCDRKGAGYLVESKGLLLVGVKYQTKSDKI